MAKTRALLGLCLYLLCIAAFAASVSVDDVYTEVLRIERETTLMQRVLGVSAEARVAVPIEANLLPRHSLAQSYVLFSKINFFKHQSGMLTTPIALLEPYRDIEPFQSWGEMQRILAEIAIVKRKLEITESIDPVPPTSGKRPVDVFNHLRQISEAWNTLLGVGILPAHVYVEATRLAEESRILLTYLGIADNAAPPTKNPQALPADSLKEVFAALTEIQHLQARAGIATVDFSTFRKTKDVLPDDVLTMLTLTLGELQTLKAHVGLRQNVTPTLSYYTEKQPADVQQVVGYATNRLRLLRSLER